MTDEQRINADGVPVGAPAPTLPEPDESPRTRGRRGVPEMHATTETGRELSPEEAAALLGEQHVAGQAVGTGFSNTAGRAGFWTSYLYQRRSIFASTNPPPGLMHYTFARSSVAADANGRRFVPQGTTLQAYGTGGTKVGPRTGTYDAVGVLVRDIDVTDSDVEITMVRRGALNVNFLWDAGTFGSVDATHVKAALPQIDFSPVDY
jgi:hypothetical protein